MTSDPERVERVAAILRKGIPDAEVTHRDPGELGPVAYTITTSKGAAVFRVAWERFQEDQDETERFVREAIQYLGPGDSYILNVEGDLIPFKG